MKYEKNEYLEEMKRKTKKPYKRRSKRVILHKELPEDYDTNWSIEEKTEYLRKKYPPKQF